MFLPTKPPQQHFTESLISDEHDKVFSEYPVHSKYSVTVHMKKLESSVIVNLRDHWQSICLACKRSWVKARMGNSGKPDGFVNYIWKSENGESVLSFRESVFGPHTNECPTENERLGTRLASCLRRKCGRYQPEFHPHCGKTELTTSNSSCPLTTTCML